MKTTVTKRKVNWIPLPDPVREEEVKLELTWSADERTRAAVERQAALMGFATLTAYLHQALASVIAGNEADTFVFDDGRLVHGCDLRH